jgi:hypothetical protein
MERGLRAMRAFVERGATFFAHIPAGSFVSPTIRQSYTEDS